jgi:hypothetical protein
MVDNHIFEHTTQVKYPSSAIPFVFFHSNINLLKMLNPRMALSND